VEAAPKISSSKSLEMTPQEQALRARLVRVLSVSRVAGKGEEVKNVWHEWESGREKGMWGVEESATTMSPLYSSTTKAPGLVLAPWNVHVRDEHSLSSDIGHEQEHDHEGDASCFSSGFSSSNSRPSFPAADPLACRRHQAQLESLPAHLHHHEHEGSHPLQFDARKASATCRAIEGYVSFASVEGLGEPPADPMLPDGGVGGEGHDVEGAKAMRVWGLAVGAAAAWCGWRRLLVVARVGDDGAAPSVSLCVGT